MASRKGANINLDLDMTPLIQGVVKLDDRLDRGVTAVFERQGQIAKGWMKENAPWTDRTANARNGLDTACEHVPKESHTLWLFGRVPYQIWLEVRFSGRFSVIIPALVDQGPKMMATLSKLFARLASG